MIELFTLIPDAIAIVRLRSGIYKQSAVWHRGDRVFIRHNGGFARICAKLGDHWVTSVTGVQVVDISQDIPGLFVTREPRWTGDKP